MKMFLLLRKEDVSGISGTGYVAEGVVTSHGNVFLEWFGPHGGMGIFASVDDMLAIHGHNGSTVMEFRTDTTVREVGRIN